MLDHVSRLGVPELNIVTKTRSQLFGRVNFFGELPLDHPREPMLDRKWETTLNHIITRTWEPMLDHVIIFFGGEPLLVRTWEPILDHVIIVFFREPLLIGAWELMLDHVGRVLRLLLRTGAVAKASSSVIGTFRVK
ncbi:hypothetical protein PF003_g35241 [Phytophthora fragariae]|nr:hypothetical protein PF003_g35241 [Phytophthora fragariae]